MKFSDTYFSRQQRYSLGLEQLSDRRYLAIPVSNRMVDYEEAYWISPDQYDQFLQHPELAVQFADECRRREHDDLLVLRPGSNRGTPV